MFDWKAIFVPV